MTGWSHWEGDMGDMTGRSHWEGDVGDVTGWSHWEGRHGRHDWMVTLGRDM